MSIQAHIIQQSGSYRRGLVLGLTMAEVMLLLIFCLLIAIAAFLRIEHGKLKTAEQQLRDAQAKLENDQREFQNLIAYRGQMDPPSDSPSILELQKLWERAGQPAPIDQFWRELVEGRSLVEQVRGNGFSERQLKQALPDLSKLRDKGITLEQALRNADIVGSISNVVPAESVTPEKIAELIRRALASGNATAGHLWPPIINLSEAGGYYFKTGSAELSIEFRNGLTGSIPKRILELARQYDVDIIEVVGHTDEQPIGSRPSNLDRDLLPVLTRSADIATVIPADNAGLGLARAVSVVSVLRQNPSLSRYKILPLSGAQLVNTNETLATSGVSMDIPERRRIEIRLRKSTPHDQSTKMLGTNPPATPKPQPQKPLPLQPSKRQVPTRMPWNNIFLH
jgi:flagellar motor protein MotB